MFKNKAIKAFLAFMFTSIFCFSNFLHIPVLAIDPMATGNEENPAKAALTKILELPIGTTVPNASFEFEVTPESIDGNDDAGVVSTMPEIGTSGIVTITYGTSDPTGTTSNSIRSIPRESGDLFAGKTFPHAGVYSYTIKEVDDTYTLNASSPPHETMAYSPAEYFVEVYVKNGNGGLFIYAVVAKVLTVDNSTQTIDAKIDPTLGGDSATYFHSQMIFTNKYTKTNGAPDPNDPDPITERTLSISKTTAGEFGNPADYFSYNVTVTAPSILPVPLMYRAFVVEGSTVLSKATLDTNNIGSGATTGTLAGTTAHGNIGYIEFTSGLPTAIKLKHGQNLVFVNTPVGTAYTVVEAAAAGYIPTCAVVTNGGAASNFAATPPATPNVALTVADQLVGEAANSAAFTNTRDAVTPAGLNLNILPFLVLICLAVAALILYFVVKSRKRKRY